MNRLILAVLVVLLVALFLWRRFSRKPAEPAVPPTPPELLEAANKVSPTRDKPPVLVNVAKATRARFWVLPLLNLPTIMPLVSTDTVSKAPDALPF